MKFLFLSLLILLPNRSCKEPRTTITVTPNLGNPTYSLDRHGAGRLQGDTQVQFSIGNGEEHILVTCKEADKDSKRVSKCSLGPKITLDDLVSYYNAEIMDEISSYEECKDKGNKKIFFPDTDRLKPVRRKGVKWNGSIIYGVASVGDIATR